MMTRRPSVCLFCQARQWVLSRRRPGGISKRRLHTVSIRPEDDGFLLAEKEEGKSDESDGLALGMRDTMRQWKLYSPIDELREAALGFDALWKRRDLRLEVLRSLSNPWPEAPHGRQQHIRHCLPEANAAVVPHEAFRLKIKDAIGSKPIRQVLRQQLLRCERPKEILRVVAVAMQNEKVADNLVMLYESIMRALYRCREHVSDPEVLKTLNTIMTRFRYANLQVQPMLLFMALKFAARTRSLPAMKKYLKAMREEGLEMSSNVFRSVIAKFSIGHRGLGEIRNGRWARQDLLQVLTGFEDAKHLPLEQQYHLGSFLDRSDWQYLHGWVAVLARCKDSEGVWTEWELWKKNEARTKPKQLVLREGGYPMTSKIRGDFWFIEQITYSGDIEKAWQMLKETGIEFHNLKTRVKDKLLENLEHATIWNAHIQAEMVQRYDRDLSRIETALGVKWVTTGDNGEGQHELYMDQEEALDKLGEESWSLGDDYGYPWETSPIVPELERPLHNAAESAALDG